MSCRFVAVLVVIAISIGAQCAETTGQETSLEDVRTEARLRSKYLRQERQAAEDKKKAPTADLATFRQKIKPILAKACDRCHGPELDEASLRVDTLDPDLLHGDDVAWWLEVQAVLSNGEMPPPDEDENHAPLADSDRATVVEWLSKEVQVASSFRRASAEHSSFRRMTRYEYNYALQDILGLPFDFAKDLPPDANSEDGFQNSSEMLHMSVTQLETYRKIALQALRRATIRGDRPEELHWQISMQQAAGKEWEQQRSKVNRIKKQFKDDEEKLKERLAQIERGFEKANGIPYFLELATGKTTRFNWAYPGAKYAFAPNDDVKQPPAEHEHVAIIPPSRRQTLIVELGDRLPDQGMMRVRVQASRVNDDGRVPEMELRFGWRATNEGRADMRVSQRDTPIEAKRGAPQIYEWHVPLGEVYPRNSVRHIAKMGQLPSPSEHIRLVNSTVPVRGEPSADIQVEYVHVTAPYYEQWPPQSHTKIFPDSSNREDETKYAREVITAFMNRISRRPLTGKDIQRKMRLYELVREHTESNEDAIVEVLAVALSSPEFLYLARTKPKEKAQQQLTRLTDFELATRLAAFLWCSVPDEELLNLASSGTLSDSETLSQQVDRMLSDARSRRISKHFVRQWLNMQLLDFLSVPEGLDPPLKEAMQQEPIALFTALLDNNESVLSFIHSDYTFANERLAQHYGIPNVRGNHFRRVTLNPDQQRGGLLTQAGLLAMNSDGKDSHPLKRGVWMLESLLNDPPPPPPPAVPEIDLTDPEIAKMTLKERIEDHRNHAACMSVPLENRSVGNCV